jgi:hypothetical protein
VFFWEKISDFLGIIRKKRSVVWGLIFFFPDLLEKNQGWCFDQCFVFETPLVFSDLFRKNQ